jgi:hypothetical protein
MKSFGSTTLVIKPRPYDAFPLTRYEKWKERSKVSEQAGDSDDEPDRGAGSGRRGAGLPANHPALKKARNAVPKHKKGPRSEIKRPEQILKQRHEEEKREARRMRGGKKKKGGGSRRGGGGGGSHGGGGNKFHGGGGKGGGRGGGGGGRGGHRGGGRGGRGRK